MDKEQREEFYIWATYLNFDSGMADAVLGTLGLNTQFDTLEKCKAALQEGFFWTRKYHPRDRGEFDRLLDELEAITRRLREAMENE